MSKYVSILSFLLLFAIGAHVSGLYSAHYGGSSYTFFQSSVRAIEAQNKIEDSRIPPDLLKEHAQRKVKTHKPRSFPATSDPKVKSPLFTPKKF